MKKFSYKIGFWCLGILFFFGMNFGMNSYFIQHEIVGQSCKTLIIGESHIRSGLNPEWMEDAANIAQPAENIFLTFHKLKRYIQLHPKTQAVILGIGHNTFSGFNDTKFRDAHFAHEFMNRAYAIIPIRALESVGPDWRIYTKTYIKNMLLYPRKKHDAFIGRYHPIIQDARQQEVDIFIQRHYYKNDTTLYPISDISIQYLDSVIYYCQEKNIELSTVYIPQQEAYVALIPEIYQEQFNTTKQHLNHLNIPLYDFHQERLDESYFANFDHLNHKGAEWLTKELLQRMHSE